MKERTYSRRSIVVNGARTGILAATLVGNGYLAKEYVYDRGIRPLKELSHDWREAGLSNDEFIEKNKEFLDRIRFGFNFSPEMFDLYRNNLDMNGEDYQDSMRALNYGMNKLGMKYVRLGIRWNEVGDGKGNIDLSLYRPYLDIFADKVEKGRLNKKPGERNDFTVILATGVKSPRWPEQHIPEELYKEGIRYNNDPEWVSPSSFLGERGLMYYDRFFETIQKEYGTIFQHFQIENEPRNSFGENPRLFTTQYLVEGMKICKKYHPDSELSLTAGVSPGMIDISRRVIPEAIRQGIPSHDLAQGIHIYVQKPQSYENVPFVSSIDQIARAEIAIGNIFEKNKQAVQQNGIHVRITEGQMENWGKNVMPGENSRYFRFMTKRSQRALPEHEDSEILIWGMEKHYEKWKKRTFTSEHYQMEDFIQKVNHHEPHLIF